MAKFLTPLINEDIDHRYSRIHEPFIFESEVLKKRGLRDRVEVPKGFVHDYESVPFFRGTSKRGGVAHDYLSRKNSSPIVSKRMAANVYFEIMETRAGQKANGRYWVLFDQWWRRWLKWGFVIGTPGYFHKHRVLSTYEELTA